jgi:hypothetical protein
LQRGGSMEPLGLAFMATALGACDLPARRRNISLDSYCPGN